MRLILLVGLLAMGSLADAKRFRNAYVSFDLPPNWNCKLEGAEWVCENEFMRGPKEAIIILTAKEVGPSDSLPAYLAQLQTPRTLMLRGGAQTKSQVIHVKERMIGGQMWVDGMHLGSEIGPYFTRYLATIRERIAILVTFSAHKEHYTKYSGDFIRAVESLRVVATRDALAGRGSSESLDARRGNETIGAPVGQTMPMLDSEGIPEPKSGAADMVINILIGALLLGAVGGYLFFKSRKKKPKVSKK
jgi:LPXTG-motif cell wall-anchored protein